MTEEYSAWLLFQEAPNENLVNLVKQLGLFAQRDLTAKPRVSLSCRNGLGVLTTPDPEALFDLIWEKHVQKKSLIGFCTAPLADLPMLHGQTFFSGARYISIFCIEGFGGDVEEPYYRRFVELKYESASLHGTLAAPSMVNKEDHAGDYPLILNPQHLPMTRGQLEGVFGYSALALQSINGVMLPPTRGPQGDSYLAPRCREVREAWSKALRLAEPQSNEPAAVSLWRLMDDPLVRDLLLDGGAVRLTGDDREPTAATIEICGSTSDSASSYRARVFLSPREVEGPAWAPYVFSALRADLESTISGGLRLAQGASRLNWGVDSLRTWQPWGAPTGTWDYFQALKERFDDASGRKRALFEEEVLNPSRRRAHSSDPENQPDHDLCERAFISRFWRCPWSPSTDDGPWRRALIDLLLDDWSGTRFSPAQRVESWSNKRWLQLETSSQPWLLEHPATVESAELQKWRLLLPLGVVFQTHGRVILDHISQLDRGYVLA